MKVLMPLVVAMERLFALKIPAAQRARHATAASQPTTENFSQAQAQPATATPQATQPQLAGLEKGRPKKILVVDDEESIRWLLQEELQPPLYQTATASNGESALRQLRQEPFDLIICDVKMPGLSGLQVYERLRVENPNFCRRMIFITGNPEDELLRRFLKTEKRPCLAKPFTLAELRQMVKTALVVAD